jgi:hypothetical protein
MKRAVVQEFCDIHFGRDRVLVAAEHTNVIIHITDTTQVPADVCGKCLEQLEDTFGGMIETDARPGTHRRLDRRDTDYYVRLRAWHLATRGKPVPEVGGKPAYTAPMKREFDAYEIAQAEQNAKQASHAG